MHTRLMICYTEWLEDKILKVLKNTKSLFKFFTFAAYESFSFSLFVHYFSVSKLKFPEINELESVQIKLMQVE